MRENSLTMNLLMRHHDWAMIPFQGYWVRGRVASARDLIHVLENEPVDTQILENDALAHTLLLFQLQTAYV